MPRGGPDIGALLKPDEVREWRSLTVANPKSKPTAAEAASLKEKKAKEKKGKDALLKQVIGRINDSTIKKDKIKKALDKASQEIGEEIPRPFWLDPPSGTRDFEPAEMKVRNWLFDHMLQTAKEFGFKEYDAPVLEHVELYERKAGEEISQQMYCFTDKEGARVTLRPEMTPSLARMVLNLTNLATGEVRAALPLKWFSIPQCWRFETTQRGRKREHYQWNMDIVGEPGIVAEVELLTAVATFFKRLGVGPDIVGIRVNSRKVLDVAITKAGVPRDKFERVCVVVDKLDKIGGEAVKCLLTEDPLHLPAKTADVILQCLQASSVDDLAKAVGLSQSDPAIAELKTLFELCQAYGVGDYLDFDASVVRGLAYYTGVVFEAFDRKGELRAICGGGRYDRLAELYGGEKCQIPFCGFGFGDCVVIELLKDYGLMPDASPSVDVVVAPFDATMQPHALRVAASLRKAGLSVDAALTACKARKAFDLANRQGARLVAFVAPGEWARSLVRVKDMSVKDPATGEGLQVDVPFAELASVVSYLQKAALAKGAAWVSLGSSAPAAPTTQVPGATLGTAGKLSLKATAKFSALAL